MPPNLAAAGISPGQAFSTARHCSWTRAHDFEIDLPVSSRVPSTANPCHDNFTGTEKVPSPAIFAGQRVSSRPNHGADVTGGRNDGCAADSYAPLAGPPLDALGGPGIGSFGVRRRAVADAPAAGAVAQFGGDHSAPRTARAFLADLALTVALLAVVAGAGIVAANFVIDHPAFVRAALGCVLAIWPAWALAAVVFGVAAWRGGR